MPMHKLALYGAPTKASADHDPIADRNISPAACEGCALIASAVTHRCAVAIKSDFVNTMIK